MSKVVQAVNAMIANENYISNVIPSTHNKNEYFFVYRNKHVWSMLKDDDSSHRLFFYPNTSNVDYLASLMGHEWSDIQMVSYIDSEIATKEAKSSFSELYTILKEKLYGINDVLDEIISDLDY